MTLGDRMYVAFWALLILANVDNFWWILAAVVVLIISAVSDYSALRRQQR